jgi:hypothetical protein
MLSKTVKATLVAALAMTVGGALDVALETDLVVSPAQARVGRPLTPISYAGVARRTTRRAIYATSVYAATLPRGCTSVIIDGTALHRCGGTYYQATGGRYVVVRVE